MGQKALSTENALTTNALTSKALTSNALTSNALTSNALTSNALSSNALTSNALTSNALTSNGLTEGEIARRVLRYLYSCAMPAGSSMELVLSGTSYGTLAGEVGLAPAWGDEGGVCDLSCQRWVSACVLARTNFWGTPVALSLRGAHPSLAVGEAEMAEFPLREGSYFGNLFGEAHMEYFDMEGCYSFVGPVRMACAGEGSSVAQITQRTCSDGNVDCGIKNVGACADACQAPDVTGGYGACSYECDVYWPIDVYPETITVYLREAYPICGNGACDAGESATICPTDCPRWTVQPAGAPKAMAEAVTASGDIVVGGLVDGVVDFGDGPVTASNDLFVAAYDATGLEQWSNVIGVSTNDIRTLVTSIAIAPNGEIFAVGTFIGTLDFGGGATLVSAGGLDTFVARFAPDGAYLSSFRAGGSGDDPAADSAVGGDGNLYLAATIGTQTNWGCGNLNATLNASVLVKYTPAGTCLWNKLFSSKLSGRAASVAIAPDGDVLFSGTYRGTMRLNTKVTLTPVGSSDAFLARYTSSGALVWAKTFGGTNNDTGGPIAVDPAGNVVIAGTFNSATIDLGGGARINHATGTPDIFVGVYDAAGAYRFGDTFGNVDDLIGGGLWDSVTGAAFGADGRVVVVGAFDHILDFPSGHLVPIGTEAYVVQYTADGAHLRAGKLGAAGAWVVVATDAAGFLNVATSGATFLAQLTP